MGRKSKLDAMLPEVSEAEIMEKYGDIIEAGRKATEERTEESAQAFMDKLPKWRKSESVALIYRKRKHRREDST